MKLFSRSIPICRQSLQSSESSGPASSWLTMPKHCSSQDVPPPLSLCAAPLGSWHARQLQWKSIEILLRGRFICILSQVALAISRCHLHNRHHHPFGMTITCPEHVASIKKERSEQTIREGGGDSGALSTCLAFIRSLKTKCYGPTRSYLSCASEPERAAGRGRKGGKGLLTIDRGPCAALCQH